jgi:polysaccharide biosynthesis protein PslJ
MDTVVRALVVGATVVAFSAIYESRSGYNAFDHLAEWIPALEREARVVFEERGGNVRVYASAQHPIALSAALFMAFPLALYLVGRASTQLRSRIWVVAAAICAMGAVATISRTTVIMGVALGLVALWVRGRQVVRFWPLLLILPVAIHFAVPGALGGIYKALTFQSGGLAADAYARPGEQGSGRLADLEPGLRVWSESPLVGNGIGSQVTTKEAGVAQTAEGAEGAVIIFDNEWLNTLVSLGVIGVVAVAWFVWGSLLTVGRFARRVRGPRSDLAAACAAAIGAFGISMFVFDAFAFVQATIFFFLIAALGLQARRLGPRPADA